MSRAKKLLIWAGVFLAVAVASHLLLFRGQSNQIEIDDPGKAEFIRNFKQSMQAGMPTSPQQDAGEAQQ